MSGSPGLPRRRAGARAVVLAAFAVGGATLGLGAPPAARAETETLAQAWTRALARDPTVAAAAADADAAAAGERAARGARWPSLEAGASYTRYADAPALDVATPGFTFRSPRIFDNDDTVMGQARLSLPLFAGGSIHSGIEAARQAKHAAQQEQRRTNADLKLDVARSYVGVLRAQRALAAAEASTASLRAHAADVEVMVNRETVPASDLLAARVALANAEQQRVRAANGVQLALAAYNRRLGESATRVPELDEHLGAAVGADDPAAGPLEPLLEQAHAQRAELAALAAQAAALGAQSKAEWGRQLPQLALVGGYDHLETTILDRQDFSSVGVGISWKLFDGGQARNRAAALRRAGNAASLRLEDLRTLVDLEVRQAWLGVREAEARIAATREAVAQSDENLRISRELYGAGLATNTQVLDAIALRIAASNNASDAVLDAALSRIALQRAIGAL
ncbi:MAG: TolC family protein [Steroidobacteraceae bacterium]